jgi:hypothetical protein
VEITDLFDPGQAIEHIGDHHLIRDVANDLELTPRRFGRKAARELEQAETRE